jgi:hypothetical protein
MVEEMDRTGNVDGVFKRVKAANASLKISCSAS